MNRKELTKTFIMFSKWKKKYFSVLRVHIWHPMLGYCWPTVFDVGPTLTQHWDYWNIVAWRLGWCTVAAWCHGYTVSHGDVCSLIHQILGVAFFQFTQALFEIFKWIFSCYFFIFPQHRFFVEFGCVFCKLAHLACNKRAVILKIYYMPKGLTSTIHNKIPPNFQWSWGEVKKWSDKKFAQKF